ncbi:MAG: carboxymuconolactone decarboxylase family protein [Pirellulales bacterium]
MARITPISVTEAAPAARAELEHQIAAHGRVTNMKCTLARSPAALTALMQWYALYDVVLPVLGQRMTTLFSHAISSQTDCLVCSTFFRRWLTEQGEDPDALQLNDREQDIVDYGRQLARDAHGVSDALFSRLSTWLDAEPLVALTAFGGMMIATNVFNNALQVNLDDYLQPFRRDAAGTRGSQP